MSPSPLRLPENRPFLNALRKGELVTQKCSSCRTSQVGSDICHVCAAPMKQWEPAAGTGRIRGVTVVRIAPTEELAPEVPYAIGIVSLDEDVQIMGRVPIDARVGDRVTLDRRATATAQDYAVFTIDGGTQ